MAVSNLIPVKAHNSSDGKAPSAPGQSYETVIFAGADAPMEKGARIGPYEIQRLLGQGGMCKVYLARQLALNRMVALKVVEGIAADEELLEMFKAEIKTTAKINHRNVVTAIEGGVSGRNYYLSMNYIEGDTLEGIVERLGPFSESRALEIVKVVAETLRYIHEKVGIFHKDIKPSNIMIDREGEIFLLDLGISQYVGDKSRHSILGSPYHMSPEQILGGQLDWRTDLYSLGTTLYFMLFGNPPFHKENDVGRILELHLKGNFPVPSDSVAGARTSAGAMRLLRKMMERHAKARQQSWKELIDDIEKLQNPGRTPAAGGVGSGIATQSMAAPEKQANRPRKQALQVISSSNMKIPLPMKKHKPLAIVDSVRHYQKN